MQNWRADLGNPTGHDLNLMSTFAVSWERLQDETVRHVFGVASYCAPGHAIPYEVLEQAVGLDARQIQELCTGEYISQCQNVILLGQSGTGKTHLATGLGIEACQQGFRTRFVTGCGLVNELVEAREERVLSRLMKRYAGYDLLILDELGYVPFSKLGSELLFQVLAERHEHKSVIVTTNLGFADWTQIFGEANLTAALLDRLTHRASILNCSWESYRLHETLEQSVVKPKNRKQSERTSQVAGNGQEG